MAGHGWTLSPTVEAGLQVPPDRTKTQMYEQPAEPNAPLNPNKPVNQDNKPFGICHLVSFGYRLVHSCTQKVTNLNMLCGDCCSLYPLSIGTTKACTLSPVLFCVCLFLDGASKRDCAGLGAASYTCFGNALIQGSNQSSSSSSPLRCVHCCCRAAMD